MTGEVGVRNKTVVVELEGKVSEIHRRWMLGSKEGRHKCSAAELGMKLRYCILGNTQRLFLGNFLFLPSILPRKY